MGALLLSMTAIVACLYMTFLAFKELDRAEQFLKNSNWIVMNKRNLEMALSLVSCVCYRLRAA